MFEGLERRETVVLGGVLLAAVAVSFVAGSYTSGTGVTGNIAASGSASTQDIRQTVQGMMDQQLERQRARFEQMANRSENITVDDLSISAEVVSVEQSKFSDLYKVNVSISGTVPRPNPLTGEVQVRDVSQNTVMFISKDGRYLFQPPTDLQQPRQPARRPSGGAQAPQ